MIQPRRWLIFGAALVGVVTLVLAPATRGQLRPVFFDEGGVGLGLALRRLPVVGGVLYITAHPDDENNGVLVMLSRGRGIRTGLLTLTRGDGGQNAIGKELLDALSVLRTEELASVHRYDGVEQYFSRAVDFGFSFSMEETLQKWGHDEILRDIVRVIRYLRPDVLLTLPLAGSGRSEHQHHTTSARLALEAFRAAADPDRFPEQRSEGLRPWQPRKIYQGGTGLGGENADKTRAVSLPTGEFDPLLGMSWRQFGVLSRTFHKCQGQNQLLASPGALEAPFSLVESEPRVGGPEGDIFEGVDLSLPGLLRFVQGEESHAGFLGPALDAIDAAARKAQGSYAAEAPQRVLPAVLAGLSQVRALREEVRRSALGEGARYEILFRLDRKEEEFERAAALAQGLAFEVTSEEGDVVRGQTFGVTARVWNRAKETLQVDEISLRVPEGWHSKRLSGAPSTLGYNESLQMTYSVETGASARYSQPYWKRRPDVDRYEVEVPADQTLPWSPPDVVALVRYTTQGVSVKQETPASFRYQGKWVGGEKQKIVNVVPALSVSLSPRLAMVPLLSQPGREFRISVLNNAKGAATGSLTMVVPKGWITAPASVALAFRRKGDETTGRFVVTPPRGVAAGNFEVAAVASMDTSRSEEAGTKRPEFREGYEVIAYDHIQERHLVQPAVGRVRTLDVKVPVSLKVGYIMGAGDEVPSAIAQLGGKVTLLTAEDLAFSDLGAYSTILAGIRAYEKREDLRSHNERLLNYVKGGGHLVVQYNNAEFNGEGRREGTSPFAPYPAATTANRVTVEEAPVRILAPEHPLMSVPNKITSSDFQGWVQERGLAFLEARDSRYIELLASADPWPLNPGEKKGMLVHARVGKGTWTYVGLSLWRQLAAGVPGAYRILANLVSQPLPP